MWAPPEYLVILVGPVFLVSGMFTEMTAQPCIHALEVCFNQSASLHCPSALPKYMPWAPV